MPVTRLPGLQIPKNIDRDLRLFLESVKERLEVQGGERKAALQRYVTVEDLKKIGLVKTAERDGYATITGVGNQAGAASGDSATSTSIDNALSLFSIEPDELDEKHYLIVYDTGTGNYRRITYLEFADIFLKREEDDEVNAVTTFVEPSESGDPTRVRFEDDSGAADEKVWDFHIPVAGGKFEMRVLDDTDANPVTVYEILRTGTTIDTIDFKSTNLYHNGAPIGGGAAWYDGTGVPSSGLGADGDYYLDNATGDVYTKAAGAWSVAANIKGPTGPSGTVASVVAGTGITVDNTDPANPIVSAVTFDPTARHDMFEDFVDEVSSATGNSTVFVDTSGAGSSSGRISVAGRPGVVRMTTGTTTTGYGRVIRARDAVTNPTVYTLGTNPLYFEAEMRAPTLPDAAQQFNFAAGMRETYNTGALVAAQIMWDTGSASVKWALLTRTTGGALTTTLSSVSTPVANQWHRVRLVMTSTQIDLYVDGVLQCSSTTNLPNAAITPYAGCNKVAGTTSRNGDVDWFWVYQDYSGGRPA